MGCGASSSVATVSRIQEGSGHVESRQEIVSGSSQEEEIERRVSEPDHEGSSCGQPHTTTEVRVVNKQACSEENHLVSADSHSSPRGDKTDAQKKHQTGVCESVERMLGGAETPREWGLTDKGRYALEGEGVECVQVMRRGKEEMPKGEVGYREEEGETLEMMMIDGEEPPDGLNMGGGGMQPPANQKPLKRNEKRPNIPIDQVDVLIKHFTHTSCHHSGSTLSLPTAHSTLTLPTLCAHSLPSLFPHSSVSRHFLHDSSATQLQQTSLMAHAVGEQSTSKFSSQRREEGMCYNQLCSAAQQGVMDVSGQAQAGNNVCYSLAASFNIQLLQLKLGFIGTITVEPKKF